MGDGCPGVWLWGPGKAWSDAQPMLVLLCPASAEALVRPKVQVLSGSIRATIVRPRRTNVRNALTGHPCGEQAIWFEMP